MDDVGWVDVLVAWILVLVLILVLSIAPIVLARRFCGVSLDGLLCVDAFEDTTFFHCVIGLGVELKALVWFWIIDETLVLTSILTVCRLNEVGTCQVMEQVMIMVMMVMTTR